MATDGGISIFILTTHNGVADASRAAGREEPRPSGILSLDSRAPQDIWESLKLVVKSCARQFTRGCKARHNARVIHLQREREQLLQDSGSVNRIRNLVSFIEAQIKEDTGQALLRSATRWHEQGERNNNYFFKVIKERQTHQTIQSLKRADTGEKLTTMGDILGGARSFYQDLYDPDAIDLESVDYLLHHIPDNSKLTESDSDRLIAPPSSQDILNLLSHAPKNKCLDGLGFEVHLYLVTKFPACLELLKQLLTNALNANRFNKVLSKLITPFQTGFMPHRLISDNGWLNQSLMANLRHAAPLEPNVAVMLDQEKAYDRINPMYLVIILHQFGFPPSLVSSLSSLFFSTQISISINGWLGIPFVQKRGLRQGDPLSRSIRCNSFYGQEVLAKQVAQSSDQLPPSLEHEILRAPETAPRVKLLSYADNLEIFLSSPAEWPVLTSLLSLYGKASNAKVNLSKTVMVSLSGHAHEAWQSTASEANIGWHDEHSIGSIRYLGYPLYHSAGQLAHFLDAIKIKLQRHVNILSQRHPSIRGKSLVANSLLLSRLWHILRVVIVSAKWLSEIQSIIRQYIVNFWPGVAWDNLCLPRKHGGIGLVDIQDQHLAFVHKLRRLPHLAHLLKLISRLPPLHYSSLWPAWWYLDLPLNTLVSSVPSEVPPVLVKIPDRSLLLNFLDIIPGTNGLVYVRKSSAQHLLSLYRDLAPFTGTPSRVFPAVIRSVVALNARETQKVSDRSVSSSKAPDFGHWVLQTSSEKTAPLGRASPGILRHFWHPAAIQLRSPSHHPLVQPLRLLLLGGACFMTELVLKLGFTALMQLTFRRRCTVFASKPLKICSTLWWAVITSQPSGLMWSVTRLDLGSEFLSDTAIWYALTSFSNLTGELLDDTTLVLLGSAFYALWRNHWRCFMEDELWFNHILLTGFFSEHAKLIASLNDM
ncbi:hypothetical protein [Parasitella parasitica]|uniref:Reverse transcriptase domain-containing protein n=1 Tax=Parasitella parasitica TaxID=35722 RepID=A0A0B7NFQ9_9FUNG|nr:hypothetical protein [Parasitella parasitica]